MAGYHRLALHPVSIHASRKGYDVLTRDVDFGAHVSIHASRKGSDSIALELPPDPLVSIHASR